MKRVLQSRSLTKLNPAYSATMNSLNSVIYVCLFVSFYLILYVPSTIFQLNRDGYSSVEPVLSLDKCVLIKDHNTVTSVRLEPAAPQSVIYACSKCSHYTFL